MIGKAKRNKKLSLTPSAPDRNLKKIKRREEESIEPGRSL